MTTITIPTTPKPQSMTWRLVQPAQNNVSQWTGARQVLASGRGWWECQITYPPIVGTANFNPWRAFIAEARGMANDFRVQVDPTIQTVDQASAVYLDLDFLERSYEVWTPIYSASSPEAPAYVNGASQVGRTLNTDGWPPSTTALRAGSLVTINNQLLQLTRDVITNSSGQATITFEPAIRVSPADNAQIEWYNPYCLMYLAEEPTYSVEPGYVYSLSLNLREAF
jgi:hypothetical protein